MAKKRGRKPKTENGGEQSSSIENLGKCSLCPSVIGQTLEEKLQHEQKEHPQEWQESCKTILSAIKEHCTRKGVEDFYVVDKQTDKPGGKSLTCRLCGAAVGCSLSEPGEHLLSEHPLQQVRLVYHTIKELDGGRRRVASCELCTQGEELGLDEVASHIEQHRDIIGLLEQGVGTGVNIQQRVQLENCRAQLRWANFII